MWMIAGIAGGIQPWWHHVGAYHDDRRMYRTAEPVMKFHKANEAYLTDRQPVASVGLLWSQRNTDFYRSRYRRRIGGRALRGFRAGADPGTHSLPARARRRSRSAGQGIGGAGAAQYRRALRRTMRSHPAVRRARWVAGRNRRQHALQRVGGSASRFRPGRSLSRARAGSGRAARLRGLHPHLSAAASRMARQGMGSEDRHGTLARWPAPPRPPRLRRNRHTALRRQAAAAYAWKRAPQFP